MQVPASCEVELLGEVCSSFSVVCPHTLCHHRACHEESPRAGNDGRGEVGGTCLCCTAWGLLFSTGGNRKMVRCLMATGGTHFASTVSEEWSGKRVNGRTDVLGGPTFVHNLINPALQVQTGLTSFR